MDIRVEKLAELIVGYSTAVRKGDKVLIQGSTLAEPLLKATYARVLQAGGFPLVLSALPNSEEIFYRHATDDQLKHVPPPVKMIYETYDVRIVILAEANTRGLSSVDPRKLVMNQQARTELMQIFMRRAAAGELRWVVAPFPTNAMAQDAEMGLAEYEDFVYTACMPDLNDPVGYWHNFSAWQQRIIDWLRGKGQVHITAPGTDLRLSIASRIVKNSDGHFNLPDGEIFTGPVEDSAEGYVNFTYPSIYGGREVAGVKLEFEKGKVVRANAEKNEDFLLKTLDTDAGSRFLGEFAIGTSKGITRFTREILFDEKIDGSFHLALGASYPETGGRNKSAVHWDMVCDLRKGGEIRVDGQLLYRDGKFVI
jgi:aminopeptidase